MTTDQLDSSITTSTTLVTQSFLVFDLNEGAVVPEFLILENGLVMESAVLEEPEEGVCNCPCRGCDDETHHCYNRDRGCRL